MNLADRHLAATAYRRFAAPPSGPAVGRIADLMATRFDKQRDFIAHPSRRKAGLCTRRAGKTELVPAYLLREGTEKGSDNTVCVYVAPTLKRARALMWKPLKRAARDFGFAVKVDETRLSVELSNGCIIQLEGADKVMDAEKKRGDKTVIVLVDECSVYRPEVLQTLVEDVYGPALEDLSGTICLLGTPGVVCAGLWYEVTRHEAEKRAAGWEVFQWSVLDNPFMAHMVARLPELKKERGWADDDPTYLREWLGRWVNDTGALFYRYDERRNTYDGTLPPGHSWRYVIGVDVGFDDAYADVVWAFSATCTDLFEVECYEKSCLLPSQWAERLSELREKYRPQAIKIDQGGLGKAFAEEMRQRHRIPVEAAEKQQKTAFVKLMNDDFVAGRIRVRPSSPLAAELKVLPKDPKDPEKEDPRFSNHATDAGLYGWREARHFVGQAISTGPKPGSVEWLEAQAQKRESELEQRLVRQFHEANGTDYWSADDA